MPDANSVIPPSRSTGKLAALAIALLIATGIFYIWIATLPPVQRLWLNDYAKASTASAVHKKTITIRGRALPSQSVVDALRVATYSGETLPHFAWIPELMTALCGVLLLPFGAAYDRRRMERFMAGRQIGGPLMLTPAEFNKAVNGDGIHIKLETKGIRPDKHKRIRILARHEAQHFAVIGDTGAGKTSWILQILDQVQANGETAIIYDPHMEFVKRHYDPKRGDVILNPLDKRCSSWRILDEIDFSNETMAVATALAQAESLFPGNRAEKDFFFTHNSRLAHSHLVVRYQPETMRTLAEWLMNVNHEIDRRIQGTELEQTLAENSPQQRAGVISTLAQIAFAYRQIPDPSPANPKWSAREWCKHRKGWIFFTSTADTRLALRPVQSLWIDSLILRMLSEGEQPHLPKVWGIFDELATLQRLPSTLMALGEGRKAGLSMVLGFHGRSEIKSTYGEDAESLLSAPFTKILLRTGEPEASEWVSKAIGDVKREKVRVTVTSGSRRGGSTKSYATDEVITRPVMASDVAGFEDRTGYLRYGNNVVKLTLPIVPKLVKAEAFVPCDSEAVIKGIVMSIEEYGRRKAVAAMALKPKPTEKPPTSTVEKFKALAGAEGKSKARSNGGLKVEMNGAMVVIGGADRYTTALQENADKLARQSRSQGLIPEDFEGPPLTRFVCSKCLAITEFDGVLTEPIGVCRACNSDFASLSGEFVRNTVMQPHVKDNHESIN